MKKFIKTILIFAIIFFIIDKAAYFVLVKTSELQSNKKLEKVITGGMDKELLVLGSSRGVGNLIGKQLENETGLSTYNISYRGGDVVFQEFIFKTYLAFNKPPKELVFVIDNPALLVEKSTLNFRYDRLYPLAHNDYINNFLIERGKHSIASRHLYLLRVKSDQLKFKNVTTSHNWRIDSLGTQLVYGKSSDFKNQHQSREITYTEKESKERIKAFKGIQDLCKKNNVRIHYIFSPNFNQFNSGFYDRFKKLLQPVENIVVYDFKNPIYIDDNYFYDVSHLNARGAKVFTSEISTYLNSIKE